MSTSVNDRQNKIAELSKINNRNRALISNSMVVSENLGKLYEAGHARNPQQFGIIESLIDFNIKTGFLTPKQVAVAAQIILQNADFFFPQSEVKDSDEDLPI